MNGLGVVSYGLSTVGFLLLTVLLSVSWQGNRQGAHLIVASAISTLWSGLMIFELTRGSTPVP